MDKYDVRTMWTIRDIAHACKVSTQAVYNWVSQGQLEAIKAGKNEQWQIVLVTDESVQKFIKEREESGNGMPVLGCGLKRQPALAS